MLMISGANNSKDWVISANLEYLGIEGKLNMPFFEDETCAHGGAFFEAIGETFHTLHRSMQVVNADVLDAWFLLAPGAVQAVQEYLPWLLKTSPPTGSEGLVQKIAQTRGVPIDSLAIGAGSSSLIYLAFREWLNPQSRVLLLDPTYGEYAHVLEQVIGCKPERFLLSSFDGFRVDTDALLARMEQAHFDLVVLVNPNNPTGQLIPRRVLEPLLAQVPPQTRLWVDEAYIDYVDGAESVETLAASSDNILVCKSLSKGYALSGARAAYLCGPLPLVRRLRHPTPPWAVGLPTQVAAVAALHDPAYYHRGYRETAALRSALVSNLRQAIPSLRIIEGVANFILCFLSPEGPDAATVIARCRLHDIFLRDVGSMGRTLGDHALRIAVKDSDSNRRIAEALAAATVMA